MDVARKGYKSAFEARIRAMVRDYTRYYKVRDGDGMYLEMNIRYQRGIVPLLDELVLDLKASLGLLLSLDSQTNEVSAHIRTPDDLIDGGVDVAGVGGRHGLLGDRVFATDGNLAGPDGARGAAHSFVDLFAVRGGEEEVLGGLHVHRGLGAEGEPGVERMRRGGGGVEGQCAQKWDKLPRAMQYR